MYHAIIAHKGTTFDQIEEAAVNQYVWGSDYCPHCYAKLLFVPEEGFRLQMYCQELAPLARFTQVDDPVYTDSCMEFFANFFPQEQEGYLNFEMNANGAILCQFGTGRGDRRFVKDMGICPPLPIVFHDDNGWGVELTIPLSFLQQIYGKSSFEEGHLLKGNFYKCGDETVIPHYGSWSKINVPAPDFHRPECFGEILLGKATLFVTPTSCF